MPEAQALLDPPTESGRPRRRSRDSEPGPAALKALPTEQRPRERLLRDGGGAGLSDAELIAVLLRSGKPGQSAVAMADELLTEHGGLAALAHTTLERLLRPYLKHAKAATLLAGLELARRLARAQLDGDQLLDHPTLLADYLRLRFGRVGQEVMGVLYLDLGHRLLRETEIYRGTLTTAAVEPRTILREGLITGAAAMVVFHTHPDGDPAPSRADIDFTERLNQAGEVIGIRLLDHMILGRQGRWVSLRQRGAC